MKYILILIFFMSAGVVGAMNNESMTQRLKWVREMGADKKEANRNMAALPPADSAEEDRQLQLKYLDRKFNEQADAADEKCRILQASMEQKLKNQDEKYQQSLAHIKQLNEEQISRLTGVVVRQTDTIAHLNSLILALLKKFYKADMKVRTQGQDLEELKQTTDSQVDTLLEAVTGQTELISRQNRVIRELLGRVDGQTNKLKMQAALIGKIQQVVRGIRDTLTNQQLNELVMLFDHEQPEVASEDSDPEIYRQVLGRSKPGTPQLGSSSEEIIKSQLVRSSKGKSENEAPREEIKEGVRMLQDSDGEMVEETVIIEDVN